MVNLLTIFLTTVILSAKFLKQRRISRCPLIKTRQWLINYQLLDIQHFPKFLTSFLKGKLGLNYLFFGYLIPPFTVTVISALVNTNAEFVLQPTTPAEGRSPPRIGNIGHMTRISNKLLKMGSNNSDIQAHMQVFLKSLRRFPSIFY